MRSIALPGDVLLAALGPSLEGALPLGRKPALELLPRVHWKIRIDAPRLPQRSGPERQVQTSHGMTTINVALEGAMGSARKSFYQYPPGYRTYGSIIPNAILCKTQGNLDEFL